MENLKLFVWEDVLWDYSNGIAFALAESKEQAIEMLVTSYEEQHGKGSFDSRRFRRELNEEIPTIAEGLFSHFQMGGG